jgi:antitoxin CptB
MINQALSWQCRRGLLELDLMLQYFVHHAYATLSEHHQRLFHEFLKQTDGTLWNSLVLNHASPPYHEIVSFINQCWQNRLK